ncbi:MAG TPA: MOSC domain-containing protein [Azospirillaceae bacterium]|nr:MOSC domain-containing protein [Azospirillaceae bacterium]
MAITLLSLNTGAVGRLGLEKGQTGIAKRPAHGPLELTRTGLEGDASDYRPRDLGDTALHAFAIENYRRFQELAGRPFDVPTFGENLTLEGYTDEDARIGDVLRVGTARVRVTQPVVRCRWPGRLSGEPRLAKWAMAEARTGFFLEVLEPGTVAPGAPVSLVERGDAAWTVARLTRLLMDRRRAAPDVAAALALPLLAERWKGELREEVAPA